MVVDELLQLRAAEKKVVDEFQAIRRRARVRSAIWHALA